MKYSRKQHQGIGLIEVIITTLVVALGIMAVASLQGNLMGTSGSTKVRAEAKTLCENKLEEFRDAAVKGAAGSVTAGEFSAIGMVSPAVVTETAGASGTQRVGITTESNLAGINEIFTRVSRVEDRPNKENLTHKLVSITCSWGNGDDDHKIIAQSMISSDSLSSSVKVSKPKAAGFKDPSTNAGSSTAIYDQIVKITGGTAGQLVPGQSWTGKETGQELIAISQDSAVIVYKCFDTTETSPGYSPYFIALDAAKGIYTRRVHYPADDTTFPTSFKNAIELAEFYKEFNGVKYCARKVRYNGGIMLPIKGTVYSKTAGRTDIDIAQYKMDASESGIYCYFKPTSPSTRASYICYVGGNCVNRQKYLDSNGVEQTGFGTRLRGEENLAPGTGTAQPGDDTIVTECPSATSSTATSYPNNAFALVGQGGWRGEVGLLGIPSGNSGGNSVCFKEELLGPPPDLVPVTARNYYTRRFPDGNTNPKQLNEGLNKPFMCHDFLVIDQKAVNQLSAECISQAGALNLASKDIMRDFRSATSLTNPLNIVDLTFGKGSCHIISGTTITGVTTVGATTANGEFDCTVNTTDNTYQCIGTSQASAVTFASITPEASCSLTLTTANMTPTCNLLPPGARYTVSGNITEGTGVTFGSQSGRYDPLAALIITGATCTKTQSGNTYSYSCTNVPENTTISFDAGLGYVSNPASVTVGTANVTQNIVINTTTTYTLLIATSGTGGTTNPAAGTYTYNSGSNVTITATPTSGYTFTGWSGACSGTSTTCTVTMSSNKTVTATFAPAATYTLLIGTSGTGGTTSPSAGTYTHVANTSVTITATPSTGYIFTGWSGDCSGTSTTCTVVMNANKTVTATFAPTTTYTLLIGTSGTGGTTSPSAGTYTYNSGDSVTITATPSIGYVFTGWSGGTCSGTNTTCTVTMNSDKTVTATFAATTTYTLLIGTSGTGGTTSPSAGTYTHNSGDSVTITATPSTGYTFTGWSGGTCSGTSPTCTVTMNSDKTVTATFAPLTPYTLLIGTSGTGGTTSPTPGTYTQYAGDVVTITATATTGYVFTGWSGGTCTGTTPTCTVTMNADKTVTATFAPVTVTCSVAIAGNTAAANRTVTSSLGCNVTSDSSKAYTCPTITGVSNGTTVTVTSNNVTHQFTVTCPSGGGTFTQTENF